MRQGGLLSLINVDIAGFSHAMLDDCRVSGIGIYLENINDGSRFALAMAWCELTPWQNWSLYAWMNPGALRGKLSRIRN